MLDETSLYVIGAIFGGMFTLLAAFVSITAKLIFERFADYKARLESQDKHHQTQIDSLKREHAVQIETIKADYQSQIDQLNERLTDSQAVDKIKDDYIYDLRDQIERKIGPPPKDWPPELIRRR